MCSKRKSTFTISNAEIKGQRRKIEESVGKEEIVVLTTCKNTVISVRDDTPCTEKEFFRPIDFYSLVSVS